MSTRLADRRRPTTSGPTRRALPDYSRTQDLPRLLPLWPHEVTDLRPESRHRLIQRLRRALREERRRGLAGHWTYDLRRHAALLRALQAEIAGLPPPLSSWAVPPFGSTAGRPPAATVNPYGHERAGDLGHHQAKSPQPQPRPAGHHSTSAAP